jgi:hypothetical protein
VREGRVSKLAPIQTNRVQDRAGEGFGGRVPKLHTIFGVTVSRGKPEFSSTTFPIIIWLIEYIYSVIIIIIIGIQPLGRSGQRPELS